MKVESFRAMALTGRALVALVLIETICNGLTAAACLKRELYFCDAKTTHLGCKWTSPASVDKFQLTYLIQCHQCHKDSCLPQQIAKPLVLDSEALCPEAYGPHVP